MLLEGSSGPASYSGQPEVLVPPVFAVCCASAFDSIVYRMLILG